MFIDVCIFLRKIYLLPDGSPFLLPDNSSSVGLIILSPELEFMSSEGLLQLLFTVNWETVFVRRSSAVLGFHVISLL